MDVFEEKTDNKSTELAPLLKRAFMFLEDENWQKADEYCERILDMNPECAEAYLGKLMAELRVSKKENLQFCHQPFDRYDNYQKILRFGDDSLRKTVSGYAIEVNARNNEARLFGIYSNAENLMNTATTEAMFKDAACQFESIRQYRDSGELAKRCYELAEKVRKDAIYAEAMKLMDAGKASAYKKAIGLLEMIPDRQNAAEMISVCKDAIYTEAMKLMDAGQVYAYKKAIGLLEMIPDRQNATEMISVCKGTIEGIKAGTKFLIRITLVAVCIITVLAILFNTYIIPTVKYNKAVKLMNKGEYTEAVSAFEELGEYKDSVNKISECFIAIDGIQYNNAVELMNKGEYTEAIGAFMKVHDYKDSKDKISELMEKIGARQTISAGRYHTVGLKSNGTVVAVGDNLYGQCDVSDWDDIVTISAGMYHTVGLKSDGTVVAVGYNEYGQCNVSDWEDIVTISAGYNHTVGLKSDGTVVAIGWNDDGRCDVSGWEDIVAISAGSSHTVGLKSDGTVVAVGWNYDGQCDVSEWDDIVAISAGWNHTVGLKSDGTVVAVGWSYDGQCDVSEWKNITVPSQR